MAQLPPTVKQGSKGETVEGLQNALNTRSSAVVSVDGVFGPATENAVKEFQRDAGLDDDGTVGPDTWGALYSKTDGEKETAAQIVLEDISSALPAVLAVGAVLVYGLLIVAYSEFYTELGVRPSDVGLQYGPGIGGIAGVALLLIIAAAMSLILFVVVRRTVEALTTTEFPRRGRRVVIAASAAVLVVCLLGAVGFAMWANDRADDVKAGKVVEPYRFLGIELLSVRADLVHVKPTGSTADRDSVLAGLHRRQKRLRYLGRNAGTLVFYDTKLQSSWHVPASMLAVHVANCETQRAEFPRCDE